MFVVSILGLILAQVFGVDFVMRRRSLLVLDSLEGRLLAVGVAGSIKRTSVMKQLIFHAVAACLPPCQ